MMKLVEPLREKIGSLILVFVLLIVNAYCNLALPQYTANIVDIGIQNLDLSYIIDTGISMLIMVSISVIATIIISFLSSRISSAYAMDLRLSIYEKVLKFSNHEINQISRASLITRSTNDINHIQSITEIALTTIIFAPILGIGSIIKVLEIDLNLSWIILVVFFMVLSLFVFAIKYVVPYFETFQQLTDDLNRDSREILIGMPVIKSLARQDYEEKKFGKTNEKVFNLTIFIYKFSLLLNPLLTLILNLMIVAIIYFGAFEAINGGILTGNIIAFIQYSTQLLSVFALLGGFMVALPRVAVSAKRVNEILETDEYIKGGAIESIEDNGSLEFKDVVFQYSESEKETLKNINFKLEPGKTTAIIGGTGSGKSTILNLISRLQDPSSGEILINGINIKDYTLESLREKLCYIPQKALLLQGSVKENVLIGNEDSEDEEVEMALENACVNFIATIDDKVAQGGSNFSGGQKQRLSIARAFLNPKDFILFDDCFSALDMNTEKKVKENLKNINCSSILVVSQRISTIRDADEIIVLDEGIIVDKGKHEELVERCEIYSEIANSQSDSLGVL